MVQENETYPEVEWVRSDSHNTEAPHPTPWVVIQPDGWLKIFPDAETAFAAQDEHPDSIASEAYEEDVRAARHYYPTANEHATAEGA